MIKSQVEMFNYNRTHLNQIKTKIVSNLFEKNYKLSSKLYLYIKGIIIKLLYLFNWIKQENEYNNSPEGWRIFEISYKCILWNWLWFNKKFTNIGKQIN